MCVCVCVCVLVFDSSVQVGMLGRVFEWLFSILIAFVLFELHAEGVMLFMSDNAF